VWPCAAINARYPVPTDPATINTSPNFAATYLDVHGLKPERFINEGHVTPNNSYYSQELPGTYFIAMSTYVSEAELRASWVGLKGCWQREREGERRVGHV
jgi:hypothetical protein